MKKTKALISLFVAVLLVFSLATGSIAAADEALTTTVSVPTTAPSTEDESVTENPYDDGYNAGYQDGYNDGYGAGFNDGYFNGNHTDKPFDIFDFIEDIRWRLEDLMYNIKDYIVEALMFDFPAPNFNSDYLPAENQAVLGEESAALCEEFNALIEDAHFVREETIVTKTANVDIDVTDIMGGELTKKLIDPILKEYLVESTSTETYFEGAEIWNLQRITLYPEGLVSAKKTENSDGTTDYEFVLKEEASYFGGKEAEYVTVGIENKGGNESIIIDGIYHDLCADTLDIQWFIYDFAPLQITGASINYPGATVKASTDAQGRLTALSIDMPVKGTGEAAVVFLKGDIALEGYRNEGYTFKYAN